MNNQIRWTDDERALVVNTLVSYLKANNQTPDHVTRPGWFAFYMQQAQCFLPEDRKRVSVAPTHWLLGGVRAAFLQTPKVAVDLVAEYVRQNLDAVIAELAKTHSVCERFTQIKKVVVPAAVREHQPRVLLCGVLPSQAALISKEFGANLDLRFTQSDVSQTASVQADYAIGLISFMSHSLDAQLKSRYKCKYHRIVGGLDSVRKTLREIGSQEKVS